MSTDSPAPTTGVRDQTTQGANAAQLSDLQRHEMEMQLRASDLQVQIGQLREQQARTGGPQDAARFNKPLADVQHEYTKARLDYEATHAKIAALEKDAQVWTTNTGQRPSDALFTRQQLETTGFGVFLLMIPLVLAFSRRIWLRGGASNQPGYDLESSPRLQRLEQAVESIAIEVERIGEAQRFATKLLSERRPEPVVNRVPPASSSSGIREPGTITPH